MYFIVHGPNNEKARVQITYNELLQLLSKLRISGRRSKKDRSGFAIGDIVES